jgi:hypothetical protein
MTVNNARAQRPPIAPPMMAGILLLELEEDDGLALVDCAGAEESDVMTVI